MEYCSQFKPEKQAPSGVDHFVVEDLFDFFNEDDAVLTEQTFDSSAAGHSTDSSTVTVLVDNCNSSSFSGCEHNLVDGVGCRGFTDGHTTSDLYVPSNPIAR